ncbi:hypothetical protein [Cohnella candidum]|uniref:Uncharacterized protein n=1 Tax=Cohnella candidum TaxID=2674991 RepID=A0A3G3JYS1_9BACL|nr:hypothetical protein [Cohnella candidum]AYQ73400.1 hypothetical protein EAV92_12950 [Cohnella candidum]
MIKIAFLQEGQGYYPRILWGDGPADALIFPAPVTVHYLNRGSKAMNYTKVSKRSDSEWAAEAEWEEAGCRFRVLDVWSADEGRAVLTRRFLAGKAEGECTPAEGVQLELRAEIPSDAGRTWRFAHPATHYSDPVPLSEIREAKVFMEDRLTYPAVIAFQPEEKRYFTLGRVSLPVFSEAPRRTAAKENFYLQKTEVGSIGYSGGRDEVVLRAFWPYFEGDRSVALNAGRVPVSAYYPLEGTPMEMELSYDFRFGHGDTFADAVYGAFKGYAELNPPQPAELPFSLEDSMEYRRVSLRRSYCELENGGAGFFFHFDPRHGYGSQPSGFGTSFNNIPHESYTRILEYGFTGRQLNTVYSLASSDGGEWIERGRKVVQFFVDRMPKPSGFLYSLYDIENDKPFASFGEEGAPKLHYISHGNIPGNYLRTMVEPAFDLLMCYQLYASLGSEQASWWETTRNFADFLLNVQNEDGSWYRAFEPDGTPLKNAEGFGNDEFSSKSASSIPILYLIAMGQQAGEAGRKYLEAARRAGDYVLETYVPLDHYLGGTLDNPNVIDKEAAQYTCAALYGMYKLTGEKRYLEGSVRAGKIFVTWNYVWNAPCLPGTDLHRADFKTVGNGGINSIWGGGVVDIYSLFHIEELDRVGEETGEDFFRRMAEWIAIGTQQVLSHPGDLMGFTDLGMQPEGFGVCNQGIDEGMIAKGDIWGTLGWIYSAGIYGLGKYLAARGR